MSETRSEKWARLARLSDALALEMEANREIAAALKAARVYPADVNRPNVDNPASPAETREGREAPIGYMLAMKYPPDNGHANAGTWQADWDGEVHPTWAAAFRACCKANGRQWTEEVAENGLTPYLVSTTDYLPYALTLALESAASPAAVPLPEEAGHPYDALMATWITVRDEVRAGPKNGEDCPLCGERDEPCPYHEGYEDFPAPSLPGERPGGQR